MRVAAAVALIVLLASQPPLAADPQDLRDEPGPSERRANPITPDNPIPRRTLDVAPVYPPEAAAVEAAGRVTVRVTVNEIGRVAEVRRPDAPPLVFPAAPATTEQLVAAVEALLEATANAVRQWQYDAPAKPPVSFNVTVAFTPSAEPLLVSQAAAPAPTRPGPVFGGGLPEPEDPAWAQGAVRLGGQEPLPRRTRYVSPRYPTEARDRRVQGVVLIAARIGDDGRVTKARVLRSIPELDEAALDAVSQWEFTPTRLNGQPIPVVITVAVSFSL